MCGVFFADTFTLNPVDVAFGDLVAAFVATGGGTDAGSSITLLPGVPLLCPILFLGGVTDIPGPYFQITVNILYNFNKRILKYI